MAPDGITTADLDPFADVAKRDPYPIYARLREAGAAHKIMTPRGSRAWLVVRHAAASAALTDERLVRSIHQDNGTALGWATVPDALRSMVTQHMMNIDPPYHARLRRPVSRPFAPRNVATLAADIARTARRFLDALAEDEVVDVIGDFAKPFSRNVISDVLGIPIDDRDRVFAEIDTATNPAPAGPEAVHSALEALHAYIRRFIGEKIRHPDGGIISTLATNPGDLTAAEVTAAVFILLATGYEAPIHLIGNGVLALIDHPGHAPALQHAPHLVDALVRETLRYDTPIPVSPTRIATTDIRIEDTVVPAGDAVLVCLASANRDERVFPHPDSFDLHRDHAKVLSFSRGVHTCMGSHLATLTGRVGLSALLSRHRAPSLAPGIDRSELLWVDGILIRGLRTLPIAPHPA
ncbi:cytochrome P450 [Wenjunlia tyrosinilytica]|uniref:Cytochrome P450 hydroxylase n=1 Tax=Wenjunlia tyrosinilytica TaxID=1544741 RepID=A0A917ZST3_9ACTN|nr:cytochrome P450 [Wenjunlia tyrosinilytica]GGO93306.1 cytochrome P450 hydroxylase [Wenjunlia tyrosinilytica]